MRGVVVVAPSMVVREEQAVQAAVVTLERLAETTSALPERLTRAEAVAAQAPKTPAHT
jgi:hypothetical protein